MSVGGGDPVCTENPKHVFFHPSGPNELNHREILLARPFPPPSPHKNIFLNWQSTGMQGGCQMFSWKFYGETPENPSSGREKKNESNFFLGGGSLQGTTA